MNIIGLIDIYFLILVVVNCLVVFFIDAACYQKKCDLRMRFQARFLSVIIFILGIILYISGQMMGGV